MRLLSQREARPAAALSQLRLPPPPAPLPAPGGELAIKNERGGKKAIKQ